MGEELQISDEVRISLERVASDPETVVPEADKGIEVDAGGDKLTTSKMGQKLGLKTAELLGKATAQGYLALNGDKHLLTAKGEKTGIEFVAKSRFGPYFLWPQDFHLV